jgi:hypothetical protein
MKKQIVILICTLLIASVLPTVGLPAINSIDEGYVVRPHFEFIVDSECGCNEANEYNEYNSGEHSLGHIPLPDWVERTPTEESIGPLLVDLDWRNNGGDYTTSAKNQQQCGACWCFAAIGALESVVEIANSNPGMNPDLSEQYPLSCTGPQGVCPNDCVTGGNAYWAFWYMGTAAPQNGALPETCFPYAAVDANGCDFNGCGYAPVLCNAKCATWQSQLVQTITGYGFDDASGSGTLTPQKIKNQLANGPVCLSIDVFADFNPGPGNSPSFDGNGIYRWDGVSAYTGGHAILCVGYQDSLGCWICKNSWGAGWGNMQGFFKIAYGQCNIEYDMSWVTFTQSGSNNPPYTPSNPSPADHATGVDVNADLSWTCSDPDTGDTLTYDVYFGTTTSPSLVSSGQTSSSYDPGTMNPGTKYYWKIDAWDNHGATTPGPLWDFNTASGSNNPPNTPSTPTGPTTGVTGVSYNYQTSTIDPDGNQVKYGWDFDNDGIVDPSHWTGFHNSGATCTVAVTFNGAGTYYLSVKAEDTYGAQSAFSPYLTIVITTGTNNPPTAVIDSIIPNPANQGQTVTFTGHGTDPDTGDTITGYNWRSSIDGQLSTAASFSNSTLSAGTHAIYFKVQDNHGAWSTEVSQTLTINPAGNNPPNKPSTPSGTTNGKAGTSYPYSTSATDPDGDKLKYGWDKDSDGTVDIWDDNGGSYYTSGVTISTSISWSSQGTYSLKVIAEDEYGAQSPWSDPLPISMPKNKQSINFLQQFLGQLIERFPLLGYILDFR